MDESFLLDKLECEYITKDQFKATVVSSTYFTEGEKLAINKTDDNLSEEDIDYPEEPESMPEMPNYDFPYPKE